MVLPNELLYVLLPSFEQFRISRRRYETGKMVVGFELLGNETYSVLASAIFFRIVFGNYY